MTYFEIIGREVSEKHVEAEKYRNTLALLREMKASRCSIDEIELEGDTWKRVPLPTPTEAATEIVGANGDRFKIVGTREEP